MVFTVGGGFIAVVVVVAVAAFAAFAELMEAMVVAAWLVRVRRGVRRNRTSWPCAVSRSCQPGAGVVGLPGYETWKVNLYRGYCAGRKSLIHMFLMGSGGGLRCG